MKVWQKFLTVLAVLAMFTGTSFAAKYNWTYANPFHAFMTAILGTLTLFLVGIALSRRRQRRARTTPAETVFDI